MATRSTGKKSSRGRNGSSRQNGRGARNGGQGNLLEVLKAEHQEVKKLLRQLVAAEHADERESFFRRLKTELQAHSHGEEEAFYPLLKEERESRTPAIEGFVEHRIAERLMEEMEAIEDKGDEEWEARAKVLRDLVEHHIAEEEGEIWNEARKRLGNERLVAIAPEYKASKERYL